MLVEPGLSGKSRVGIPDNRLARNWMPKSGSKATGRTSMSELLVSASEHQSRLCQNLQDSPLGGASWSRLHRQSETRSVFLTYPWLSTWWQCFGADSELHTIAVLRGDELVGIAPLLLRHEKGLRVLEFLGSGLSDRADVIASQEDKPQVLATIFETLLRRRDRWDRLRLGKVPAQSSTVAWLEQLRLPEGWEYRQTSLGNSPALSVERSPAFAQLCTRKRSLVRQTRNFERLSPLQFRHVLDLDEVTDLLPQFFEMHRDRRFMAGDRSPFDDVRNRRFIERAAVALLESGWLRFSVLRWRDELLACHFGFFYDRVATWYLPAFNVDYARSSPGVVLLKKLLEDAMTSGAREFDFGLVDSPHKERFANVKRELLLLEILQPQAVGNASETGSAADEAAQPAAPPDRPRPRFGRIHWLLWRAAPCAPVPSDFRVQWARYSQIKAIVRQEGMKTETLIAALARLRRGDRAVVALWQERPVALLWLARDPSQTLSAQQFQVTLPEGAAVTTEALLVSDLLGSPRRETLMPAVQTFLAAEGVSALYGITPPGGPEPLPVLCGNQVEQVARRTEVAWLFGRFSYQRQMDRI